MGKIAIDKLQVDESYRLISGDCQGVYHGEIFNLKKIYYGKYANVLLIELLPEKLEFNATFWKDCIFEKV